MIDKQASANILIRCGLPIGGISSSLETGLIMINRDPRSRTKIISSNGSIHLGVDALSLPWGGTTSSLSILTGGTLWKVKAARGREELSTAKGSGPKDKLNSGEVLVAKTVMPSQQELPLARKVLIVVISDTQMKLGLITWVASITNRKAAAGVVVNDKFRESIKPKARRRLFDKIVALDPLRGIKRRWGLRRRAWAPGT